MVLFGSCIAIIRGLDLSEFITAEGKISINRTQVTGLVGAMTGITSGFILPLTHTIYMILLAVVREMDLNLMT